LSSSSLTRGPPPNSNANNSNPPDAPKPDPRPKEVRFGNFPQRLYRDERQAWLTGFFSSVAYDALDGVKATFGKESGEAFIICKFPSFDEAVKFVNKFKGNPALDFEGTQIYISVNYFGRKKVQDIFFKKALKLLNENEELLGIQNKVIKPSWASGGILIDRKLIGHVLVDEFQNADRTWKISFRPNSAEALQIPFDSEHFADMFKTQFRL
jgi:hypothetical protein